MSREHDAWVARHLGQDPASYAATDPDPDQSAAAPVELRPSEFIAGASGVQEATNLIADQAGGGADYAQGARQVAQANTPETDGYQANPMQSADLGGTFAVRRGIGFLCFNYPPGWTSLASDVGAASRPNSAFMQAFSRGITGAPQIFTNLNRGAIVARANSEIAALARALPPGGAGELIISFQGHGDDGGFYGSDGQLVSRSDFGAMRSTAEASRVSLTIATTGCFSGAAVPDFQDNAATAVDGRIQRNVEGAGQMSSLVNHAAAGHLSDQMAHARELIRFSDAVSTHHTALEAAINGIAPAESAGSAAQIDAAWQAAMTENAAIVTLVRQMQSQFHTNMDFGGVPQPLLTQIDQAFTTVLATLTAIQPNTSFDTAAWLNTIGHFQDQISDRANDILRLLNTAAAAR